MRIEVVHIRLIDNPNPHARFFTLDHPSVEDYWLSVVGPTSVAILRHIARNAGTYADPGVSEATGELAGRLGLRAGAGRWAALLKTLDRLHHFGHAHWDLAPEQADDLVAISVYDRLDVVPSSAVRRWNEARQAEHRRHLDALIAAKRANRTA
jgi:hypothetical protein